MPETPKGKTRKDELSMSKNILSQFPKENNYRRGFWYYFPVTLFAGLMLIAFLTLAYALASIPDAFEPIPEVHAEPIPKAEPVIVEVTQEVIEEEAEPILEPIPEPQVHLTDDDLIAAVIMGEARGERFIGKVAVAATVLNRADGWEQTVEQVVTDPGQFAYPYIGVIFPSAYEAVYYAKNHRGLFPKNMYYFRNDHYHPKHKDYIQIGNHYFSTDGEPEWDVEGLEKYD